jgi:hypothetical protein
MYIHRLQGVPPTPSLPRFHSKRRGGGVLPPPFRVDTSIAPSFPLDARSPARFRSLHGFDSNPFQLSWFEWNRRRSIRFESKRVSGRRFDAKLPSRPVRVEPDPTPGVRLEADPEPPVRLETGTEPPVRLETGTEPPVRLETTPRPPVPLEHSVSPLGPVEFVSRPVSILSFLLSNPSRPVSILSRSVPDTTASGVFSWRRRSPFGQPHRPTWTVTPAHLDSHRSHPVRSRRVRLQRDRSARMGRVFIRRFLCFGCINWNGSRRPTR